VVKEVFHFITKDHRTDIETTKETSTTRFIQTNFNDIIVLKTEFVSGHVYGMPIQ
jgi:hypothetical protein